MEGELGGLEEADVANDDTFDTPLQASEALPDFFGVGPVILVKRGRRTGEGEG